MSTGNRISGLMRLNGNNKNKQQDSGCGNCAAGGIIRGLMIGTWQSILFVTDCFTQVTTDDITLACVASDDL